MNDPYTLTSRTDIKAAIGDIDNLYEMKEALLAHARQIDGFDAATLTSHMDDLFSDLVRPFKEWAEDALPFATDYAGPTRADIRRDERMAAEGAA